MTKEIEIDSAFIDYNKELIIFDDVDINEGEIIFSLMVNDITFEEKNTNIPTYYKLNLKEIDIKPEHIEKSFFVGNLTAFNISIRIIEIESNEENKNSKKEKEDDNGTKKSNVIGKNFLNIFQGKEYRHSFTTENNQIMNKDNDAIKIKKENTNIKEEESEKGWNFGLSNVFKKFTILKSKQIEPKISEENEKEKEKEIVDTDEHFLKGIYYDLYLSESKQKLDKKNIKEILRETFCEGFFITSFPRKEGQIIENSDSFTPSCGHKECSGLPAMMPEIIARYPLQDTKELELNNLAATICFPSGIKVCYSENTPTMINDYVTPITNQKGERLYMMTYHFYYKILNDVYTKIYEMHPLKHLLMKFGDGYLQMNDNEINDKIIEKIQTKLEQAQKLGFRDYVYVPYCICLISKYPFVKQMKKCLQSIYYILKHNLKDDSSSDLNNLIMYLINSVPIPEIQTRVKFYIPYYSKGIKLIYPKIQDLSVMNTSISQLLNYFSIDNLIIILRLILFEKKILFIDDDYTRLSLVTDNFISLLYPFEWIHTYIPIMSYQMLKYLETFLPFLNGVNSSLINSIKEIFEENECEDSEEVFLIYIMQNKIELGNSLTRNDKKKLKYLEDNVPGLPVQIEKELKSKLKLIKEQLDSYLKDSKKLKNIELTEFDLKFRHAFIEMFINMFHDYYKYLTFLDEDVVFNKNLFLEKISNSADKKFYDEFLDTQLFQQFCQNIVKDELKYFTSKVMDFDPDKSEKKPLSIRRKSFHRTLTKKFKRDKLYTIVPFYLKINAEKSEIIEKVINDKYKIEEPLDKDGMIISQERIITKMCKLKEENYKNKNCFIYTLPETEKKEEKDILRHSLKNFKLKTNIKLVKKDKYDITEKEKDAIKETIKDFTMKIFKSEDIGKNQKLKMAFQNVINTPFGRQFFVSILSKNLTNIILLKEKSFNLLGALIYNSLLFVLNIKETEEILEEIVILVKSTKYFGEETNGKTITLWEVYNSRIQGYSKVNQNNFWVQWYKMEHKNQNDKKADDIMYDLGKIMIDLKLDKSFIKNVIKGLGEKEFGKQSSESKIISDTIVENIKLARYRSKEFEN